MCPLKNTPVNPEIQAYLKDLAHESGVTPRALFDTKAQTLTWDENRQRWIIRTDRGDEFRARFIVLCAGSLSQPKMPTIDGIETFNGRMFLNSRWDYEYTGGSPGPIRSSTKLHDERVAIVGTGCSAVQAYRIWPNGQRDSTFSSGRPRW